MTFVLKCSIFVIPFLFANGFKFQFVSILNICGENYTKDELTLQAFYANQTLFQGTYSTKQRYQDVEYKSFDVCFDLMSLTSVDLYSTS